jgi:PAS domain S-box-containing protein
VVADAGEVDRMNATVRSVGSQTTDRAAPFDPAAVPILMVDDNPAKRLALKAVLLPLGYSIVEADSGLAALRCVMAQDFAVILLDVLMPIMDGFETAALIRQRRQSETTPIIFITAHGRDEIANPDLYAEGAVDFIFAPVPPPELRAKVRAFANLFVKAVELASQARDVQASADRLRLLTEAAPIGIFQTDNEGRYEYTNPYWTEMTGIAPNDAAGLSWETLINSEERAGLIAELPDGVVERTELRHRYEILAPDSNPRIVLVTSKSVAGSDGETAGWVGTVADVTAEAGAEAAMSEARDKATDASRQKSDFLANMSHEIRTPMNGVIGMTELLLETDLDTRQRDYAQTVRNSGEALLTIINNILDFSKVEAGMLEIEEIEFGLRDIVGDVVDLLGGPAKAKGLELVAVVESSVPAVVSGDPGRVRQVLTNLIGNAIKFTQSGEILVRATAVEPGGEDVPMASSLQGWCARFECERRCTATIVRFEVTDTGDGIAPNKLATIFQPFVQADTSTSRRYGGTGLGLTISGQLVALMGGDCGVSSRVGAGSTFWFTICVHGGSGHSTNVIEQSVSSEPRTDATSASPTEVTAQDPSTPVELGVGRLLLVEDNLINQKVALAMLSSAGYDVDTVLDGAAAVKAVAAETYDAILMDCQMPEMNGYEATAAIRAHDGPERHTPIIAMTAGARRVDRDRCLAAGMDSYLAKPMSKDALLALVARSLKEGPGNTAQRPRAAQASVDEVTIDPVVFDELRALGAAGDQDLLTELVDAFVKDTEPLLVKLGEALEAGDAPTVGRIAHNIKGSCGQLGGRRLASSFDRLERRANSGGLSLDRTDLQEVEADYLDLRRTLAQRLSPATGKGRP